MSFNIPIIDFEVENWFEIVALVLLALCVVTIVVIVACVLFYIIDHAFCPKRTGLGVVAGKKHVDAYTSTHMMMVGKTIIPQTSYHPEEWRVYVAMGQEKDYICVDKAFYERIDRGADVQIKYSRGRLSGGFHLKTIKEQP